MRCAICGLEMDSTEEAIVEGWVPYILEGESEQEGPVCSSCLDALFEMNEYGEFVLREEYRGKVSYQDGGLDEVDPDELDTDGLVLEYCDN
ncbi:MAG: hypothetical protein JRI80_03495 [Deltaproteobacteria bacterium]|nr:hypothetical protein [Deltaproteobacteria bacterium]